MAHLIMVERGVISKADRVIQKKPKRLPLLKRFHLPMALVEARLIRRKSPFPPDPEAVREKEEMLAELREVRVRTLAFMEETGARNLGDYKWAHPFLGTFSVYDWMQFIASHEIRHTKQMQEIAANLPKVVARLQN